MFNQNITRTRTFTGATSTTSYQVFTHDDRDVWVLIGMTCTVTCQLHVGLINLFPAAGAVVSHMSGISGAVSLATPIPIPPGFPLTITQVGATAGRFSLTVAKLERR